MAWRVTAMVGRCAAVGMETSAKDVLLRQKLTPELGAYEALSPNRQLLVSDFANAAPPPGQPPQLYRRRRRFSRLSSAPWPRAARLPVLARRRLRPPAARRGRAVDPPGAGSA